MVKSYKPMNAHGEIKRTQRKYKANCLGCDSTFKTADKLLQRLCDNCKNTWRWRNM
jgi:rRNA maturation endonuclease Nob1